MSRAAGASTPRGDRDPVPGKLRSILEGARRQGLPFPTAWLNAVEFADPPPEWRERQGGGVGEDQVSPLEFAKRVFAHAYARIPLRGDVTVLVDDDHPRGNTPRPEPAPPSEPSCCWGRPECGEPVEAGERFCGPHGARLAAVRADLEASDGRNSREALPGRGLLRRRAESPSFTDVPLVPARAAVLG